MKAIDLGILSLASGGSEALVVSSLSQSSGPKSLFNVGCHLVYHNPAVEHNISLKVAIAATIAKNKEQDPVSLLRKMFTVFLPPNQLTSQSVGLYFVEQMSVLSTAHLPATPLPALHFAGAKCMGCVAYDLLAIGGFDVETLGHGYEIEDVLLRLLVHHQQVLMPWVGEPPAPQAQSISLAKTEFSTAGGATLPPQGWQQGLHTLNFSEIAQMQLELVNPELKATLDMSQPARICLQQLYDKHAVDRRAKYQTDRLVRNVFWDDKEIGLPPPLTAEHVATWLASSQVSAGWYETSRNQKINVCFHEVLDLLRRTVPVTPEQAPPFLEPASEVTANVPYYFEPRPKAKTTPFFEPKPKTATTFAGCATKSKPMAKATSPLAPSPEAAWVADALPGSSSSSSMVSPASREKPEDFAIFGISARVQQQQSDHSRVKPPQAAATRKFPGFDGPGLFLVTFGVAYVGQGLCNFGDDATLKTNFIQRVPGDALSEEEAAEIVSATIGVDHYTEDAGMDSLRQVEVVALDVRSFGDPPPELHTHIGQHPGILHHITTHENFAPWLRYALAAVQTAALRLQYNKQSRLYICCFDNQGRTSSATFLH